MLPVSFVLPGILSNTILHDTARGNLLSRVSYSSKWPFWSGGAFYVFAFGPLPPRFGLGMKNLKLAPGSVCFFCVI